MLTQIKNKILGIDMKVRIGGLIGIAAIAGLLIYNFKTSHETPKTKPKKETSSKSPSKAASKTASKIEGEVSQIENPEKMLIRVINGIKKTLKDGNKLQFESIKGIYNGQIELSRKQFSSLTLKNRTERRKALKDMSRYLQLSKQYDESIQDLHNKHINGILAHFRIDKGGWMDLLDHVTAENGEEWNQIILDAECDELNSLRMKDKPTLGLEMLCGIQKFKAKKLTQYSQTYLSLTTANENELYAMIEKHLDDLVYEQYKVEIEDYNFSKKKLNEAGLEEIDEHQEQVRQIFHGLIFKDGDSFEENEQK